MSAAADADAFCGRRKTPICNAMSMPILVSLTLETLADVVPNAGRPSMRALTASATLLVTRFRSVVLARKAAAVGRPALLFTLGVRETSKSAVTDAFCEGET